MHYSHLTRDQRCHISAHKSTGMSGRSIALKLNIAQSTVNRELKRNHSKFGVYKHNQAHDKAIKRKEEAARAHPKVLIGELRAHVVERLRLFDSPVQISGALKRRGTNVSHETIYKLIIQDREDGGDLYKCSRHGGKKWRKNRCKEAAKGAIRDRIDISERPAIVEEKSRVGDLEIDLIVGSGASGYIVTIVDRHSKAVFMAKTESKEAAVVTEALVRTIRRMRTIFKPLTITSDNGSEFAFHKDISRRLEVPFFFATPYHSWERGLNEHTNGLIRQFFPKRSLFTDISDDDIFKVQFNLNNRPRRALNFQTPLEVLLSSVAVALHG